MCLMSPALAAGPLPPLPSGKSQTHTTKKFHHIVFDILTSRFSEWSFLFQLLKSDILFKLPEKLKNDPLAFG